MSNQSTKAANGKCPSCRWLIPMTRAHFERGRAFACRACGATLQTDKAGVGIAVALFALASYLGKEFGFIPVIGLLALFLAYEWLTVRVATAPA